MARLHAGSFKAAELISYLQEHAGAAASPHAGAEEEDVGSGSSKGKKEEKVMQVVRELNVTDFEALTEEEDAWLIAFYAGEPLCIPLFGPGCLWQQLTVSKPGCQMFAREGTNLSFTMSREEAFSPHAENICTSSASSFRAAWHS